MRAILHGNVPLGLSSSRLLLGNFYILRLLLLFEVCRLLCIIIFSELLRTGVWHLPEGMFAHCADPLWGFCGVKNI